MLYQLVYSSVRTPKCTEQEIDKILDACKRNNATHDVTGVLLHSDNYFIQYLEGSKEIINLYDKIKTDPRHSRVVLLSYGPISTRSFPSWQMGYKKVTRDSVDFLTDGNPEEKKIFNALIKGERQSSTRSISLLVKFFSRN